MLLFGGSSINILDCGGDKNTTPREGITKTRQSGLHQKSRLQLPKMFETQTERCPVNLFQKYLLKRPVGMEKSGPFYLQPIVNPLTKLWFIRHLRESTISIL